MVFNFDPFSFLVCLSSGFAAGFIDSTVGGGGLIALPALLYLGIPIHNIVATNKLHAAIGTGFALHRFKKQGLVDIKKLFPHAFLICLAFSCFGSYIIKEMSADFIHKMVPIIMIAILLYKIFYSSHGLEAGKQKLDYKFFILLFAPLLGFYDGFFGPGSGMLWIFVLVTFLGQTMVQASGNTKLLNLASNLGSLIIFIPTSLIIYKIGLVMALGQIIGSYIGVNLSIKKGAKFINITFIIVMAVLVTKLFYKYYFS